MVTAEIKVVTETIDDVIKTSDNLFDAYNKRIDLIVPWKELKKTIDKLDESRGNYSVKSAEIIGEIKTLMLDGMDAYFSASQNVYGKKYFYV